ncbi:MAG: cysteinyl-tRNA synthetase, partial [Bradyrhizobium sp.]|nr:cysteinyl-tRNA synthetase [Bradyrhizobium sp.]
ATEHIPEMRTIIERLVQGGFAYVAEDHVLFSPQAMNAANSILPRYGALSKRTLDEMIAGARVDVAPYKRDPADFVLWKPSKPGEPSWPSPSGIKAEGRPGWHIECSAMAWKHLGEQFDIHGGGIDLVFPHHENELAQSCCAFHEDRMANVWMHNGFLEVEGAKMSKSEGNFVTIRDLLETDKFGGKLWDGPTLRFAMLRTHYRSPIDWTVKALEESRRTILNWANILERASTSFVSEGTPAASIISALSDDLNTPMAIGEMHRLADAARKGDFAAAQSLHDSGKWLGIIDMNLMSSSDLASGGQAAGQFMPTEFQSVVNAKVDARKSARARKDFKESDRIRDELAAMGVALKDGKDPVTGEPTTTWEIAR